MTSSCCFWSVTPPSLWVKAKRWLQFESPTVDGLNVSYQATSGSFLAGVGKSWSALSDIFSLFCVLCPNYVWSHNSMSGYRHIQATLPLLWSSWTHRDRPVSKLIVSFSADYLRKQVGELSGWFVVLKIKIKNSCMFSSI